MKWKHINFLESLIILIVSIISEVQTFATRKNLPLTYDENFVKIHWIYIFIDVLYLIFLNFK